MEKIEDDKTHLNQKLQKTMCNFRFHYSCKTSDFVHEDVSTNKVVQIFGESHPNYENSDNVSNAPANSFLDMIQSSERGNLF